MPALESRRGLPPKQREAVDRRNGETLSTWHRRFSGKAPLKSEIAIARGDRPGDMWPWFRKESGYDWQTAARGAGLSDAELARLGRDKLLIEDVSFKQAFEAYILPPHPVFITSDSLLNAFHVLFEDSFRELEAHRTSELRLQLERVLAKARELMKSPQNGFKAAELAPGCRHAQLVVGPALVLLGSQADVVDADVRGEINRQVDLIRRADTQELPPWLGPASRTLLSIDYRRCKPVGFYTQTEPLQNYFRAVRWLQSVPFRADRDDELTAIGLLGYAVQEERWSVRDFFRGYTTVLGRPDDPSLYHAAFEFQYFLRGADKTHSWDDRLQNKRRWLLRSEVDIEEFKKLTDTYRLPPDAADKLAEIQFRVLSSYRLPDSLMLTRTAKPDELPSSLAVAVLLGSDFARKHLTGIASEKFDAALAFARDDWHPSKERDGPPSLYDDYLDVLAALSAPADPDAPDFMRAEPWAAKSCLTVLGSWAQMRHTFTLQAKEDKDFGGGSNLPPGFVEPNPEFFSRLADLCERAARQFEAGGVFLPRAASESDPDSAEHRTWAGEIRNGGLRRRWDAMGSTARRLEAMAHKQLRRQPWTPQEDRFTGLYGTRLAFIMGYYGNSWLEPRDDAPRWATVAGDPNTDRLLAVGVGRPRLLHVLYPWQGGEILCTGSVMSYYEYAGKERLTDEQWKARLDSKDAPPPPAWLAPYLAR